VDAKKKERNITLRRFISFLVNKNKLFKINSKVSTRKHILHIYLGIPVRSHSQVAVSWTCHLVAGDANTRNYEKVGVKPQNLNVIMLRTYAVKLLVLSMGSSVNEGNTSAQHFIAKYCTFLCPVTATIINIPISV